MSHERDIVAAQQESRPAAQSRETQPAAEQSAADFLFPPAEANSILVPCGGSEAEPLMQSETFEPNFQPSSPRLDSLQLETRGLTSHQKQTTFWARELIWKESIISKLNSINRGILATEIRECHTTETIARCNGCQRARIFWNRCDKFFCPICSARLSRERKRAVEWWTKEINQPKHVVLTVRNTHDLTDAYIDGLKYALAKLRRQKVFAAVKGGFYTIEVTNEGRGWHVHFHLLCDARWIDSRELAIAWAKLVGQEFAIVKVKDVRDASYLNEVTKYAVKGNELATWPAREIAQFIEAFTGKRLFGVFGSLYGKRTEFAEWIAQLVNLRQQCECGCSDFSFLSPNELEWQQLQSGNAPPPIRRQHEAELNLGFGFVKPD